MTPASLTHLVLIPSYNPGPQVVDTVLAARRQWTPVWIGTRKICRLSGGIELNLETGKATLPDGMQSKLNELKRAYSHQAVKLAAKMNGLTVQAKGLNKLQVMRGAL